MTDAVAHSSQSKPELQQFVRRAPVFEVIIWDGTNDEVVAAILGPEAVFETRYFTSESAAGPELVPTRTLNLNKLARHTPFVKPGQVLLRPTGYDYAPESWQVIDREELDNLYEPATPQLMGIQHGQTVKLHR